MSADLISNSWPCFTAFTSCQPARAATFAGRNFATQEPMMMSGCAARSGAVGNDAVLAQALGGKLEHVVTTGDAHQL